MTLTIPATGQWAGHRHSIDSVKDGWIGAQVSWLNTVAWGTQYRAIYVPVRVVQRVVVKELAWVVASPAAGNCDVGIYDQNGTRIVSTGSQANTTTNATRVFDVTDTTIGPGLYYLGLNNDTTTDTFYCYPPVTAMAPAYGVLTETLGSVTLPATASWGYSQTLALIPVISALLVTELV